MKRILLTASGITVVAAIFLVRNYEADPRLQYEKLLREHPFNQHPQGEGNEGEKKRDRPDLAKMQDYLRTMDPQLLRPTPEVLNETSTQMARVRDYGVGSSENDISSLATSISETEWVERGPNNVGGRTRALMFDPNDNKKVWAGGVSGGLWFNDDITDANSTWQKVNDFWDNLAITCIAADPNNPEVFYVGTGEGWFNLDLVVGAGIWKTSDGGDTWGRLPSTTGFMFVNDIVVRDESGGVDPGVVYAAVQGGFTYKGLPVSNNGLQRSTDGGAIWNQVLPSSIDSQYPTDIELAANDDIFVGARTDNNGNASIYQSSNGTTWSLQNFSFDGRVELATAPLDPDVAYAIFVDNDAVAEIRKTTDGGADWSTSVELPDDADLGIPIEDFSRSQAWYDLILAVHPTNPNMVFAGAINLFRSTDGGSNWTQISKWSNNANMNTLSVPLVHADQHQIIFRPDFPNEAIFGTDGGVYYSPNATLSGGSLSIGSRNTNYNVTQFYSGAIHPTQENYMLGGTQDNGTQKFTLAELGSTSEASGGDGAMCFIDEENPSFQIVSYVFNTYSMSTNGGVSFNVDLLEDQTTGNFINTADYDSKMNILYTYKTESSLYRVKNIIGVPVTDDLNVSLGAEATAIRVSPFPTTATNLYIGTQSGRLFKVLNAHGVSPVDSEITGPSFPTGSISSISFGEDEDQILVTFSNYGVISVWETRDGGANWSNKEGNLPNMPVRWAEYHHIFFNQVYIATELGVWSTDDISVASPIWNSTNGGLANVRTDMLRIKKNETTDDGTLMAATHGRGVFTALIPSELSQTINFGPLVDKTFGDPNFPLSATSTSGLAVSYTSSDPTVVSLDGSVATIVSAGTTVITASQAGNVQYLPATSEQQALTVNKAPQTISFSALPEKTVNDPPFTVTATSSSNGAVTFESTNTAVATVSGNTVTIVGAGTTDITAKQSGSANYLPAPDISQELVVVSRIISLTGDLSFGEVIVGEEKTLTFQVENEGTAPLNVNGITYPPGYTGTSEAAANVIVVSVTFKPTGALEFNGDVMVASDATSGTNTIAATGTGILITAAEDAMDSEIKVYPNPAKNKIVIESKWLTNLNSLLVRSSKGANQLMPLQKISDTSAQMDISTLANGVYLIAIPAGKTVVYKKIIKE